MLRVMTVFGTRPEAIKLAPIVLALEQSPYFQPLVVATAQHREMLDQVLRLFKIEPHFDLEVFEAGQTLSQVTIRSLERLTPLMVREEPDSVLVQGDTTSTFVAALAAFYHRIPVIHVEAGLRTGDIYAPYPEEINRRLTTQVTSLHLAPTVSSKQNLLRENIDEKRIVVTGNTVIDALLWTLEHPEPYEDPLLKRLYADSRRVVLVTAHRRESWDKGMTSIGIALSEVARAEPDVLFVFPIHRNPIIRAAIAPCVQEKQNVELVEPLSYETFARLIARSHLILTDSGGLQEEAPSLGKPVLVMRDTTERREAVAAGCARLVGTSPHKIVAEVRTLLNDEVAYSSMANVVNPFGDGQAARRSIRSISHYFGKGPPADQFSPQ